MMKLTIGKQVIAMNLVFAFLLGSIVFPSFPAVRIILGLPAILFLPGYALMLAFFPNRNLGGWERVALSIGLSIAVVPLIGMLINYTPWGIRLYPALLSLWLFILAASLLALYRQRRLAAEPRISYCLRWKLPGTFSFASVARRVLRSEYTWLFVVLLLAYGLTFIPHLDYPYPLHTDEWMHLAYSRGIQEAGGTIVTAVPIYEFPDFVTGQITLKPGDVEPAFHVLWAIFQQATDISWLAIFRYFPGIIFLLTVLSIYVLARREKYGLEAAFFTSLMPTSVTMLGPSLLVPVALGLMYLPLCLYLVLYQRTRESYLLLAIFFSFLPLMHLPTAVILAIILLPFLVFGAVRDWKHSLAVATSALIPLLAFSFPVAKIAPEFAGSFLEFTYLPVYLPYLSRPVTLWGYAPIIFFIAGVFLISKQGGRRGYALILACVLLLVHNMVFAYWHLGVPIIYHRSPHHLVLLMSLLGGYALYRLRNLSLPAKYKIPSLHRMRPVLLAVIVSLILVEAVTSHAKAPFYHMIDEQDYDAFVWIGRNLPASYDKAILDPWKATAFMALARRDVYSRIQHAPQEADAKAGDFLHGGSSDTTFLREKGISIVYSWEEVDNDSLVQLKDYIYVLPKD
jgi:hypothetical protein